MTVVPHKFTHSNNFVRHRFQHKNHTYVTFILQPSKHRNELYYYYLFFLTFMWVPTLTCQYHNKVIFIIPWMTCNVIEVLNGKSEEKICVCVNK